MSHSSGKESRTCTDRIEEKASGIHIVPSVDSKFPGHRAYRMKDRI